MNAFFFFYMDLNKVVVWEHWLTYSSGTKTDKLVVPVRRWKTCPQAPKFNVETSPLLVQNMFDLGKLT